MVPRAAPAYRILRVLGIAIELPEQLRFAAAIPGRIKAVEPAVASAEEDLRPSAQHSITGRCPLGVHDVGARRVVAPENLAGVAIESQKARRLRRRQLSMAFVDAI